MSSKPLTILVFPINAVGHVNACLGTTTPLLTRGHRVIFLLESAFEGHVTGRGFEEDIYKLSVENFSQEGNPGEDWAKGLLEKNILGGASTQIKWLRLIEMLIESEEAKNMFVQFNAVAEVAIEKYKPDLVFLDMAYLLPAVRRAKIPWIHHCSVVPQVYCTDETVPPCCSGLPIDAPRDDVWRHFRQLQRHFIQSKKLNDYIEELGYDRYPGDASIPHDEAFLVVYAYPEELNHEAIRAKKWFNLEVFNPQKTDETFSLKSLVGERFYEDTLDGRWSGKWVYLALGSMGSIDLELMGRLMVAVGQTRHKFIVSKGPRHAEFELPANAFGDRYLPQTAIISRVHLVISHAGNNTTTETFAAGRPLLLLPLFGDQFDSAQRVHETGHGRRLAPYEFTTEQMVSTIDELLADEQLQQKMDKAARRLQTVDRHRQLAELIEAKLGHAN